MTGAEQAAALLPPVVCVTGTDTDVGKTIVTAALAVWLAALGRSVAVYKPTQAGTDDGKGDIDVVRRLAQPHDVDEGIRLTHAMAPVAAAQRGGVSLPALEQHLTTISRMAATHDHTLVEGAGGLLVALDEGGHTLADIAAASPAHAAVIVVCRSGLGTLNHTDLTLEALERRGIEVAGLVLGSWPTEPTDIEISNREYLTSHRVPLIGAIPEGAGRLTPARFRDQAPAWIMLGAWNA